jgi:hypothetical protein
MLTTEPLSIVCCSYIAFPLLGSEKSVGGESLRFYYKCPHIGASLVGGSRGPDQSSELRIVT